MFGNLPSVQLTSFGARQTECRVHKRDMGKGLGEISQHAFGIGIIFLGIKPYIIGQPLELAACPGAAL